MLHKARTIIICLMLFVFASLFLLADQRQTTASDGNELANDLIATPIADTYVASGISEQRRPSIPPVWIGNDTDSRKIRRALLKFALGAIGSDDTIDSAVLNLYMEGITSNDAPLSITALRLLEDFPENINWDEHKDKPVGTERSAPVVVTTQRGWYQWQVKDLVQAWLNEGKQTPFFGLRLQSDESRLQPRRSFWSRDCTDCSQRFPRLEVQFSTPTPTPTNTATAMPTSPPTPGVMISLSQEFATPTPNSAADSIVLTQVHVKPASGLSDNVDVNTGDIITYTAHYKYVNGATRRDGDFLRGTIPLNTAFVQASEGRPLDEVRNEIRWGIPSSNSKSGEVFYSVRRTSGSDLPLILHEGIEFIWQAQDDPIRSNILIANPYTRIYVPIVQGQ